MIATGDIVQDESRAGYERFRACLEPLGVPVASIPGNHDDPKLMSEVLTGGSFQVGGEVRLGGWSIAAARARFSRARTRAASARRASRAAPSARSARESARNGLHAPSPVAHGQHLARRRGTARCGGFLAIIDEHPNVRARRLRPRSSGIGSRIERRAVPEHAVDVRAVSAGQRILCARRAPAGSALAHAIAGRAHRDDSRLGIPGKLLTACRARACEPGAGR